MLTETLRIQLHQSLIETVSSTVNCYKTGETIIGNSL